jgi:hypothetical protein
MWASRSDRQWVQSRKLKQMKTDGIGWGEFLQVRIRMDLRKLLPRGRRVKIHGDRNGFISSMSASPEYALGVESSSKEGVVVSIKAHQEENHNMDHD